VAKKEKNKTSKLELMIFLSFCQVPKKAQNGGLNAKTRHLRNPGHADQGFRCMPIIDSISCRSLIPAMPITDSGDVDQTTRK
jgi:hypothetical protein